MKLTLYFFTSLLFLITSCTGVQTTVKGLENQAFIEVIGDQGKYTGGVTVIIDDNTTFMATINKHNNKRPKGNKYAITTGTHKIVVKYLDEILYSQTVFLASQETRQIILP